MMNVEEKYILNLLSILIAALYMFLLYIDYIDYEDKTYIVLIEEDPAANEVTILEVEDGAEEDEENYLDVEDTDILQAVFEIFKANLDAGEYSDIFE